MADLYIQAAHSNIERKASKISHSKKLMPLQMSDQSAANLHDWLPWKNRNRILETV